MVVILGFSLFFLWESKFAIKPKFPIKLSYEIRVCRFELLSSQVVEGFKCLRMFFSMFPAKLQTCWINEHYKVTYATETRRNITSKNHKYCFNLVLAERNRLPEIAAVCFQPQDTCSMHGSQL